MTAAILKRKTQISAAHVICRGRRPFSKVLCEIPIGIQFNNIFHTFPALQSCFWLHRKDGLFCRSLFHPLKPPCTGQPFVARPLKVGNHFKMVLALARKAKGNHSLWGLYFYLISYATTYTCMLIDYVLSPQHLKVL